MRAILKILPIFLAASLFEAFAADEIVVKTQPPKIFFGRVFEFLRAHIKDAKNEMQMYILAGIAGYPDFNGVSEEAPMVFFSGETGTNYRPRIAVFMRRDSRTARQIKSLFKPVYLDGYGDYETAYLPLYAGISDAASLRPLEFENAPKCLLTAEIPASYLAELSENFKRGAIAKFLTENLGGIKIEADIKDAQLVAKIRAGVKDGRLRLSNKASPDFSGAVGMGKFLSAHSTLKLEKPVELKLPQAGERGESILIKADGAFAVSADKEMDADYWGVISICEAVNVETMEYAGTYFKTVGDALVFSNKRQKLEKIADALARQKMAPAESGEFYARLCEPRLDGDQTASIKITPKFGADGSIQGYCAEVKISAAAAGVIAQRMLKAAFKTEEGANWQ